MSVEIGRPGLLYLLLLIPLWWAMVHSGAARGVPFVRGEEARRLGSGRAKSLLLIFLPDTIRTLALAAGVVALADPHLIRRMEEVSVQGKGVSLAMDISSSMLADDLGDGRRRIDVAREAAIRFAEGRVHDELSLVAFAGEAVARVPPTTDRELIVHGVQSLEVHLVRDGSDISQAVLAATAQLMGSDRQPRVVVVLSDGAHNGIRTPPLTAARTAGALDVRVHGISILGSADRGARFVGPGMAPVSAPAGTVDPGEEPAGGRGAARTALEGIASLTGGAYFRATTAADLDSIYGVIDRIEASTEETRSREERRPLRPLFVLLALGLLACEGLLRASRWSLVR